MRETKLTLAEEQESIIEKYNEQIESLEKLIEDVKHKRWGAEQELKHLTKPFPFMGLTM